MPRAFLQLCVLTAVLAPAMTAQQRFAPWPRAHLPAAAGAVAELAQLDADGDGDVDLVSANSLGNLELWLGDGDGVFALAPSPLPAVNLSVSAIAVGDIDGDNLPDIVVGGLAGRSYAFVQVAPGVFSFGYPLPLVAGLTALAMFDVDGDNDLDLVSSGTYGTNDELSINDGTGRFTNQALQAATTANELVPFDADGDGDRDVLIVALSASRLLRNDGGALAQTMPLPSLSFPWRCADAGDVDGDGDQDLVIGTVGGIPVNQTRLLLNQGNGTFVDATATNAPVQALDAATIDLVDIDRDGDLDVLTGLDRVLALVLRQATTLWLNNGSGAFTPANALLPANDLTPRATVLADVDGDGDPDLVFGSPQEPFVHLYWNDGGPLTHATAPAFPMRQGRTDGVAAADLDGDALPEVVAVGWHFPILGSLNKVLANDGTGSFREAPVTFPFNLYTAVGIADMDGDGDRDFACGLEQGAPRLFRNDGALQFVDVSARLPASLLFTRALAWLDYDGDGDQDLLFANVGPSTLLRNDGAGMFTDVTATALPVATPTSGQAVAVGDVDGDGDPDLVLGDAGTNRLLQNRGGSLGFVDASAALPTGNHSTRAVALADVDGDGDLDLLTGSAAGSGLDPRSWLLFNDGTGGFLGGRVLLSTNDVTSIAIGDVEGDGDVDFALAGLDTPIELFDNRGFALVNQTITAPGERRRTRALAFSDVDGDGDLDLFEGGEGSDRLHRNLHRQLRSRRLVTVGGELSIELSVTPGLTAAVPAGLVAVGFPAVAPTPTPFGPLRLQPGLLSLLPLPTFAPGALDATVRVRVPANAALVGLRLASQALAIHGGGPAAALLTGLVVETVRN